jgi:predicted DNA binding protein
VSETKTKSDRVKKRGVKRSAKKAKRRLRGPTAKEAIEALERLNREAAASGKDKMTDEEIEAVIQAYRAGR